MKEQWSISKEKLASLEEGQIQTGEFTFVKPSGNGVCYQLVQGVKLILYLQLILFVGWAGYTILQPYRVQSMEVKVTGMTSKSQSLFDQETVHETDTTTSTAPNDYHLFLTKLDNILTKSILKQQNVLENSHDTLAKAEADDVVNAAQNTDSEINTIRIPVSNTNSDNEFLSQNIESSSDSTIEVQDPIESTLEEIVETNESKAKEDFMVWSFPFQWSIHGLEETANVDEDESENKEKFETPAVTEKCGECDDMNSEERENFRNYDDAYPSYEDLSVNEGKLDYDKSDVDKEVDYKEGLMAIVVRGDDPDYLKFISPGELFGI